MSGVFVIGSARSGTTLMGSILMTSGNFIDYRAESLILSVCKPKYGNIKRPANRERFLADWFNSRQFARSGLGKDEFIKIVDNAQGDYFAILADFMDLLCRKQDKLHWVEGTPDNLFFIHELLSRFPDCRIIHMIRDGRDVAISLQKLGWISIPVHTESKALQLWWGMHQWRESVSYVYNAIRQVGTERILTVHYENIVENPESELEKISEFLGIRLTDQLSEENPMSALSRGNTAFGESMTGISRSALYRWKTVASGQELKCMESAAAPLLEQCGYEVRNPIGRNLLNPMLNFLALTWLRIKRFIKNRTSLGKYTSNILEIGKS